MFTDLRLAAPLIVANHLGVVGINDYEAPETVRQELMAIYYGEDGPAAIAAMHRVPIPPGTILRYAMFSDRQSADLPGIKGYDYTFKGAPLDFTDKYVGTSETQLIYEQGGVRIFRLNGP